MQGVARAQPGPDSSAARPPQLRGRALRSPRPARSRQPPQLRPAVPHGAAGACVDPHGRAGEQREARLSRTPPAGLFWPRDPAAPPCGREDPVRALLAPACPPSHHLRQLGSQKYFIYINIFIIYNVIQKYRYTFIFFLTLHSSFFFFIKRFIFSSIYKGNIDLIPLKNRAVGLTSFHLQFG